MKNLENLKIFIKNHEHFSKYDEHFLNEQHFTKVWRLNFRNNLNNFMGVPKSVSLFFEIHEYILHKSKYRNIYFQCTKNVLH